MHSATVELMGQSTGADTRDRLLTAAAELILKRGYDTVSVSDICTAADVKKGSFYHFFDSKQELALAGLTTGWDRTKTIVFADAFGDVDRGALASIDRFGALLAEGLERYQASSGLVVGCGFGNLVVELGTRDEAIRRRVEQIFDEMRGLIAVSIERGVTSGELRPDVSPLDAATDVVALMEGLMVLAKARRNPSLLLRLGPTMTALIGGVKPTNS